jgi:hypothetical protein
VRDERSPLMCVMSFAFVMAATAARPAVATAQDVPLNIEEPADAATAAAQLHRRYRDQDHASAARLEVLARPDARIAFGVRRGAIRQIVAKSTFADVYEAAPSPWGIVTLVTVHRFGQRASGRIRVIAYDAPMTLRRGPSEEQLRIGAHPPIVWNLAERLRIAFGRPGTTDVND